LVQREAEVEAQRMKDQFFALVSHELRTPLTSIMGYVDLILDGEEEVPELIKKRLGVVDRNATRLLRLVSDLLFVAQVEAGAFQLETSATDLQNVAQTSLDALRPRATAKGISLVDQTDQVCHVDADPDRMGQAIDNLVSNAIKFTDEGGTVTVRVVEQPDGVEIEVADSGVGIPEADQPLLFDRFFRSSNADAIPGMGLGLAITKAIVEGHGGCLSFESSVGKGTTFRIQLPAEVRHERPAGQGGPTPVPLGGEAL
jgi:signal transduction histidine kinase